MYVNTYWSIQVSVSWILTTSCSVTWNVICNSDYFPHILTSVFLLPLFLFFATGYDNLAILIWLRIWIMYTVTHTHGLSVSRKLSLVGSLKPTACGSALKARRSLVLFSPPLIFIKSTVVGFIILPLILGIQMSLFTGCVLHLPLWEVRNRNLCTSLQNWWEVEDDTQGFVEVQTFGSCHHNLCPNCY